MCKCQSRKILIGICKLCKLIDDIDQLCTNELHCLCHNDDICVIANITACCTQMDDTCCLRTLLSICIHMTHNVMTHELLTLSCHIVVDILYMAFQFFDLLVCDTWVAIGIF